MPSIFLNDINVKFIVDAEMTKTIKSTVAQFLRPRKTTPRIVHALQSVSLSIRDGERVGLIGPNGAGKSTLLKVMARIYPQNGGEALIEGHVCPLFEFITGFEMEATGWDNIRTRALLLGISPKEIENKIEEIAEFTNLGEFLDMPVRCYSSGMLLRLAFATSTAVDPEILLLDEVMAAGDAAFIQQARKRMDHLMKRASIVVFATHSLNVLPSFCERTIWLDHGRVMLDGPTPEVISAYERSILIRQ
ncbi:MAG: sugar ABC transporter [Deltaproteobacteria bacterium RBG_16_49_23]|nr:MAG: sugar ABC transporter [Deltaproteobacteria bacterium RBG_16_49_23]